jgi:arylsulfatase A-like enzyme/Flp pilus assembly protein TadD
VTRSLIPVLLLALPACRSTAPPAAVKPNVLLITVDTLRADRVGRGLTPAIDSVAARGVRFVNARATAPLTLPSHTSILTGTLPQANGVRVNGVALPVRPTLARAFHDAGYRTGAFIGAYVLDRRFGLSGGFDTYDDRIPRDPSGAALLEAERRGDVVMDAALAWLGRTATAPFFAWIHLYDPHAPYDPPQEYLTKAGGRAYDGEVAFADAQIGRVLEWLDRSGQRDRTLIAIAGDHGEGLGDHGELTHGMLAYDSTLRVPLIVVSPEGATRPGGGDQGANPSSLRLRAEGSVTTNVSLADLAGTLLESADVPIPQGMRPGPLQKPGESYSESKYPETAGWHALSALAFDQWKVIVSSETELYDLRVDPGESRNLAGEKLSIVEGARRRLAELQAAKPADAAAVPSDAADRLRALGYVSGAATTPSDDAANPAKQIAAWNTFERELTRLTQGDTRAALPGLTRLARAFPDSPVFQATYARALKDSGAAAQAVQIYRRLVARWPQDAAMYHDLAVAATAAGMPAEAARAERASLALQPANAAASNGLGLLLIAGGNSAEAVTAFERAVQDDPSNATFWSNLGNARREAGDAVRAEQAYRTALDRDPRSADAANGMGVLLVQQHRAADAIRWFERALAGSPRFVEARLNLGIAYQESGNREKAIEEYRRVEKETPPDAKEHRAAAELLRSLEKS